MWGFKNIHKNQDIFSFIHKKKILQCDVKIALDKTPVATFLPLKILLNNYELIC